MYRLVVGAIALLSVSAASAQVIYAPPPQVEIYNPFYENLNPQAVARIRALSDAGTFARAYGPAAGWYTGYSDRWGNPQVTLPQWLEYGIDPQTGQAMYFRKTDLLPQENAAPEPIQGQYQRPERPTRRAASPTTRPAGEYPPGTLMIKFKQP